MSAQALLAVFRHHWSGGNGLTQTLLVPLLAVHLFTGVLRPQLPQNLWWLWPALMAPLLVWQLTGAWRAVDAHIRTVGGMILVWLVYAAMVLLLISSALRATDVISLRVPLTPAPVAPEPVLAYDPASRSVLVEGSIEWPLHTALERALRDHANLRQVRLHSEGGKVFAARGIARLLIENQLDTRVTSKCYSACTLIFLAGNKRSLTASGELGFHRYAIDEPNKVQTIDIAEEIERDQQYFRSRGLGTAFIEKLYQASPGSLWKPAHNELRAAGVMRE